MQPSDDKGLQIKPEAAVVGGGNEKLFEGGVLPEKFVPHIGAAFKGLLLQAGAEGRGNVMDAAQSGGVIPIHAERDGIDYLCCAGHKGLYGPMGTGMLITKNGEKLESLIQGGTGTRALELDQPREMPEYLESGTQNVPGILALGAGMDFVRTNGEYMLREREMRHIRRVYEAFKNMPHVVLYTAMPDTMYFVPVLGFNVRGMQSEEVGEVLAKRNIAVRCGFHCAPPVHRKMGTDGETPGGAVRVSPGAFTTDRDITELIRTVYSLRAEVRREKLNKNEQSVNKNQKI